MKTRRQKPPGAPLTQTAPIAPRPVPWMDNGELIIIPAPVLKPIAPRDNTATESYLEVMRTRGDKSSGENREKEIKLDLEDPSEISLLMGQLGDLKDELTQFNLFYEDTAQVWKDAKFSVRFRLENDQLELTIKGKGKSTRTKGLTDRLEETMPVDRELWKALSRGYDGVPQLVRRLVEDKGIVLPAGLDPDDLVLLGGFTNTRLVYGLPGDAKHKVELDRSVYPNGVEAFEAEMELHGAKGKHALLQLRKLFARAGVEWRPSDLPKMARLRAALTGTEPV